MHKYAKRGIHKILICIHKKCVCYTKKWMFWVNSLDYMHKQRVEIHVQVSCGCPQTTRLTKDNCHTSESVRTHFSMK